MIPSRTPSLIQAVQYMMVWSMISSRETEYSDPSRELSEKLKQIKGVKFSYAVFPKDNDEIRLDDFPVFSCSQNSVNILSRLIYLYMSCEYKESCLAHFSDWLHSSSASQQSAATTGIKDSYAILASYQVRSFSVVSVAEPDDNFVGFFFIYSSLYSQKQLEDKIEQTGLFSQLEMLHFYLTRRYPRITNPDFHNGSMKERTAEILHLTASGKSCSEIMQILPLSANGVNYHLGRAKSLLNARNKAELIYNAKRDCFI